MRRLLHENLLSHSTNWSSRGSATFERGTTTSYYIKTMAFDVVAGMGELEQDIAEKLAAQNLRDTDRTLNLNSGAMAESVN